MVDKLWRSAVAHKLTIVSLFSGAGGFDWGFHLTSRFKTCFANELLEEPVQTLARQLGLRIASIPPSPSVEDQPLMIQGDVAQLGFDRLNGFRPDLVIGGPPCQDFSIVKATERQGIEVHRGKLYTHFVRAVLALQPKAFVFENVPGLMSANNGRAYETILQDFLHLSVRWDDIKQLAERDNGLTAGDRHNYEILFSDVVDAFKLGVPQTRRRLIIVGLRDDLASRLDMFKEQGIRERFLRRMSGAGSLLGKYPLTAMEVFEGVPLTGLRRKYRRVMEAYRGVWDDVGTEYARAWRDEVWNNLALDVLEDYFFLNRIEPGDSAEIAEAMMEHANVLEKLGYLGRPVRNVDAPDRSNIQASESESVRQRMWRIPPDENYRFVLGTPWEVSGSGLSLIYRRACPLKPAPTVVAYGGGGTWGYHYDRERSRLTNRERARLQTFTDDFTFAGGKGAVRAQIGEAVPPLLATEIAKSLLEVFNELEP